MVGFYPFVFLLSMAIAIPQLFAEDYETVAEPLLDHYCFDCHGDGRAKGEFSMDEFEDLSAHLQDIDHWLAIWKNVRSQIMPPSEEDQLEVAEKRALLGWIEKSVFKVDPENPDPGRVTIRRLNRQEYYHAISDLLGVDYNTWENFPADDTGYGFDTIGDVLTISPLHMEKYLAAAFSIADQALPSGKDSHIPERHARGKSFWSSDGNKESAHWLAFAERREVKAALEVPADGEYEVHLSYGVRGAKQATDQTARIRLYVKDQLLADRIVGWDQNDSVQLSGKGVFKKGKIELVLVIDPEKTAGEGQEEQFLQVQEARIKGPLDESYVEYPEGYRMLMVDGPAPSEPKLRNDYARKILRSFVGRAFRRPVDPAMLERLVKMVSEVSDLPDQTFEAGLKQAITAVLASPRFLFRAEVQSEPDNPGQRVLLDEYALASRLSFFLWSSVPDDELLAFAERKELRKYLRPQIDRMLADPKSYRFTNHFVGQWLQSRDVQHWPIDPWQILRTRDRRKANRIFSSRLRKDMQKETEMFFDFILKRSRPAIELINANYSFLNKRLAEFYEVPGVIGDEHQYVELSKHPERGGILGQGGFHVVTSNPTRTSPVKRGLFVLEQLLGTPAPPAPPNTPELEEVAAHHELKSMTMRQKMEIHREKPACAGCHARMDPIGLGLENFNAIGQYRKKDGDQPIDSAGVLVTGEEFSDVAGLKEILATARQEDFYRCLAEKLLTYGIGRGIEHYDSATIESAISQMKKEGGTLKALVLAVIESVPFQMRRGDG